MFTKIKENGKLMLLKTILFNLGLPTGRKFQPIKGSAMRKMPNGKLRRAYFIDSL